MEKEKMKNKSPEINQIIKDIKMLDDLKEYLLNKLYELAK